MDKRTFKDIFEKTQKKLSGWKSRLLNLAGRVTLVKHVTSCLPCYHMQTMALPMSVCKSFDKMNRDFIWRDTGNTKRIHLVNWDTVCKNKKQGGLGVRKTHDNNLAILTKLGWKIMKKDNSLWVKVMRSKYFRNGGIKVDNFKKKSNSSVVFREVFSKLRRF